MFIAKQEIVLGAGKTIAAGAEVENPTRRMKELGLVEEVKDAPAKQEKSSKQPKKKAGPVEEKVEVKVEDEILVEDSADISVEAEEE